MKTKARIKFFALLLSVCMLVALAGCEAKAAVNPNATNGNGTPSVNLDNVPEADPVEPETDLSAPVEGTEQAEEELDPALAVLPPLDGPTHPIVESGALESSSDGVIEIREKMFVAQSNEIYYNAPDYLGKTIKYEGLFVSYTDPNTNNVYHSVFRYGPGCCGFDGNCGFEVVWTDGRTDYPENDDWVEVVGVLEDYEENGAFYLRLALTSLKKLDVRGEAFVTQ